MRGSVRGSVCGSVRGSVHTNNLSMATSKLHTYSIISIAKFTYECESASNCHFDTIEVKTISAQFCKTRDIAIMVIVYNIC